MLDVSSENLLRSVFHTLAYADVFDYPLSAEEVCRYLTSLNAPLEDVTRALANRDLFMQTGVYYTLPGREAIVATRKQRAAIAARLWPRAACYARIIAKLPFVRMVAVTGSLAMNNADEGGDVDLMIVSAPNRLWTCRALSLLLARIARLEGISLCPNYLVTANTLGLKERSLYVAHELAQMIPLSGLDVYQKMRRLNDWTDEYLPNASGAPELPRGVRQVEGRTFAQRILETLFNLPFGHWFEKWEMNRKIEKLSREQSSSFESYFSADVCKGHIDRHGETVVTALAMRMKRATEAATTEVI